MTDHQSPFQAHAECESREARSVDSTIGQDLWIDHATTAPLDPTPIEEDVYFGRRLGEGKEGWTKSRDYLSTEDRLGEVVECNLEVRHCDRLVNDASLNLAGEWRVRGL